MVTMVRRVLEKKPLNGCLSVSVCGGGD